MKYFKEVFLAAIFLIIGFFSWYFLYLLFYKGFQNLKIVILAISFLVMFGVNYSLFSFLSHTKKILLPTLFLISILPILIFGYNLYLALILIIFFILITWNSFLVRRERDLYTLQVRKMWILCRALPMFFLSFSLIIAVIFYLSPSSVFKLEIPRQLYDFTFTLTKSLISFQLPGFNEDMTVDEYLTLQYFLAGSLTNITQLPDNTFLKILQNPRISKFPEKETLKKFSQLPPRALETERQNLSKILGVQVQGNEKLKEVLYRWLNSQLLTIAKPYEEYISLGVIFLTFLTLQVLNLPYKWFSGFISWILLELLILFGIVKKQKELVEREIITL